MAPEHGFTYTMHLEVYFRGATVRGILETNLDRLSNYLVVRQGEEVFSLRQAILVLPNGKSVSPGNGELLIYMQEVLFIADLNKEGPGVRSEGHALFVKKDRNKALLGVGGYLLQGDLHLPVGGCLHEFLLEKSCFLPVTEASLLDRPDIGPRTYLVNRAKIAFVSSVGLE